MSKKKYHHKLTYKNQTTCLIKETSSGMLLKFPLTVPNSHIQFVIKDNTFSGHLTIEGSEKKYSERFEIDISKADFYKMNNFSIESFITQCNMTLLPGRVYLGGFLHLLTQQNIDQADGSKTALEDFISESYLVKREELSLCRDKIWIAYDRTGGASGKWYSIGVVYGTIENEKYIYISWEQLLRLLVASANLPLKSSIQMPKRNVWPIPISDKEKTMLRRKGKKIIKYFRQAMLKGKN